MIAQLIVTIVDAGVFNFAGPDYTSQLWLFWLAPIAGTGGSGIYSQELI